VAFDAGERACFVPLVSQSAVPQQYVYPRVAWLGSVLAQDFLLLLGLTMLVVLHPPGGLGLALGMAIAATLAWNLVTLHLPSRIEVDEEGISFFAYRRVHRFAWRDIRRIHIRRFVVRDRVLVRIVPSAAWSGRYWLFNSLEGYDRLLQTLEHRAVTPIG
jgi:hypothetical protein